MIAALLPTLLPIISRVIDKVVPDTARANIAKADMEQALIQAHSDGLLAQLEVNKVEAAHRSIFVAGWRPAIGWIGVITLAWNYIVAPAVRMYCNLQGIDIEIPQVDMEYIMELIFGMLGIAGMRSWEKSRGLAK